MQGNSLMDPREILEAIREEGDRMVHALEEHERRELVTFRRLEDWVKDHEARLRSSERFRWKAYGAIFVLVLALSVVEAIVLREIG